MRATITCFAIFYLSLFGLSSSTGHIFAQSNCSDRYWAAKYSHYVNFSHLQSLAPGGPLGITAYTYYIQYGPDLVIELRDPGNILEILPVVLVKWSYKHDEFTRETLFRNVKRYYVRTDSIHFYIDDSRYSVHYLCESGVDLAPCDSVALKGHSAQEECIIVLSDSIKNMKFHVLFYPDIEFLPESIYYGQDTGISAKVLDQVIYGKDAIDALLSKFSHEGYELISDDEMNSYKLAIPLEEIKKLNESNEFDD